MIKKLKKKIIDQRKYLVVPKSSVIERRYVNNGYVGLKALESGFVTKNALEAARKAIRKSIRKTGKILIRTAAYLPVTKKPAEIRMGKGRGKISAFVSPVIKGKIMFEIRNASISASINALNRAAVKLPLLTKPIIFKDRFN